MLIDSALQFAKELLKPAPKKFEKRSVQTYGLNDIYASDICDMSNISKFNDNIKYLLIIMDIHSRFVWLYPMKTKNADEVLTNFKTQLAKVTVFGKNLWTDRGKEYVNKKFEDWCDKNNINLYHTGGESKSVFAERFIRTLRGMISKYTLSHNTERYIDDLDKIISEYNNKKHRMIKDTPANVWNGKHVAVGTNEVIKRIIPLNKYKIGDFVRISRVKDTFEKSYTPNWSEEVFKITSVDNNDTPVMYQLEDLLGELIKGKFYEPELQKTKLKDYAIIEKIIRKRVVKNELGKPALQFYVKYRGYDKRFNEWIDKQQLVGSTYFIKDCA